MEKVSKGVYLCESSFIRKFSLNSSIKAKNRLFREFESFQKISHMHLNSNILVPNPIKLNKQKLYFDTSYIPGITLNKSLDSNIFYEFGKQLSILHRKDKVVHGELEVQDIIYYNSKFYMVDLPNLNRRKPIEDYCRFKISIYIHQLKNPLKWNKFNMFSKKFTLGYLPDSNKENIYLRKELNHIVSYNLKLSFKKKLKGLILYLLIRPRL